MNTKQFFINKLKSGGDKKYVSNPELIEKNAKELMEDENFLAVMEALGDD